MRVQADAEQLAVTVFPDRATWHFERGDGILSVTLFKDTGRARAEWLLFDDDAQDWIGHEVSYSSVKHLIPEKLYS